MSISQKIEQDIITAKINGDSDRHTSLLYQVDYKIQKAEFLKGDLLFTETYFVDYTLLDYFKYNRLSGCCFGWYSNGVKKSECNFLEGDIIGNYIEWYDCGQQKYQEIWVSNSRHGDNSIEKSISWYKNGIKKSEQKGIRGFANSSYFEWYENGQIKCEELLLDAVRVRDWYENGQVKSEMKSGLTKEWYVNGQIKYEEILVSATTEKQIVEWYENGQIKSERNYFNGILDGLSIDYNQFGLKISERIYKNGQEWEGTWRTFFDNGKIESEKSFVDGQLNGYWSEWFDNGQLESKIFHVNGKWDGEIIFFNLNGTEKYRLYYKEGEAIKSY
jgi:antitoxin component YwqK of YwqJK toxin-antitoxin module